MNHTQITQQYLADLGLTNCPLDLEFLNQLQRKHIAKYSFNSISVLLNQPMPLDLPHLYNKLVAKQNGGYCFEHNKLVYIVLQHLGFKVKRLLAKVVYNRDIDVPRTHRATLITFEGADYLLDAGFGPQGAFYPLKLELDTPLQQGNETFQISQKNQQEYHFQVLKNGEFFTLYTFDLNNYTESDCDLSHFYSHKHPEAAFVKNLVVSRKTLNHIHSLRNGQYHHITHKHTEITPITCEKQLHQLLNQQFNLNLDIAVSTYLFSKFAKTEN
ncbi:arylamine N-acetyltransferase [Pseudoalteromonas luteoviolacea]|uniref:arylamine N-acetyltransferase family protein n=1 Tax=Pseudoalteromonas luteoviolacea TaxID=43657 RepID=UPI001B3829B8|nr:arylamine N-acetyltransferase [Pseudoalteromonas luteoviolacea]MBQ4813658.1 arylamine N-acetyltransferase [Pseudoalteromonas luteoviolacea]